jgi:glycosyltransferase involved in cell wall biosynthesis
MDKKYRVLLGHNNYLQPGGEDQVFEAEKLVLVNKGHHVIPFLRHNLQVYELNPWSLALQAIWSNPTYNEITTILKKSHLDIAHFHNVFPLISPSAYYACRSRNVPVVQTLHNYRIICPAATLYRQKHICLDCTEHAFQWPGIMHACYRTSRVQTGVVTLSNGIHKLLKTWQRAVDIFIALTEFSKRLFTLNGIPEAQIFVKPNFLTFDPGLKESAGEYALYVGRLTLEKGILTLLKTWKQIGSIPLIIAGDGPLLTPVKQIVADGRLDNVKVLGQVPRSKIFELIKKAKFLIFPSEWYEGFPMTIIEAFACGVPILASNIGVLTEIIQTGKTGLKFKPGDPNDLGRIVEEAWSQKDWLATMARNARDEYLEKYTLIRHYENIHEIYHKAILSRA